MAIMSNDGRDRCRGYLLDKAVTNEYDVYLDAEIDDETEEIDVMNWSPIAVSTGAVSHHGCFVRC